MAHSWIFTGDQSGSLKKFVYAWLQICACESATDSGDACGKCPSCRQMETGKYQFLYEIKPVSKSRQILVDEIRNLEHRLFLKTGGAKKIALICEADRMGVQAQNAFLKTLEEPPANSVLVLITTNPAALLPTIISRCQVISLFNNSYVYEFKGKDRLFKALSSMRHRKGAVIAVNAAETVIDILGDLRKEAESAGKEYATKPAYLIGDTGFQKKLDDEVLALKASTYHLLREQVISAIHTWYAQEYLRANNVSIDLFANPELYGFDSNIPDEQSANLKHASNNLRLADQLNDAMRYNIDDKLAIQDFFQKVCQKQ